MLMQELKVVGKNLTLSLVLQGFLCQRMIPEVHLIHADMYKGTIKKFADFIKAWDIPARAPRHAT